MREQFDVHPDTLSGHGAAVVALAPELEGVESEVRAQRLSPAKSFRSYKKYRRRIFGILKMKCR